MVRPHVVDQVGGHSEGDAALGTGVGGIAEPHGDPGSSGSRSLRRGSAAGQSAGWRRGCRRCPLEARARGVWPDTSRT